MIQQLCEHDCQFAIQHGEFAPDVIASARCVAVILTQSWCPQWNRMQMYLPEAEKRLAVQLEITTAGQSSSLITGASDNLDNQQKQGTKEVIDLLHIYYIEYDREPWFETFMEFKETVFNNREIPYVRYYKAGKLTNESNYVPLDGFIARLK